MRYDERDTIFSRLMLKPDSKEFNEYYLKNPEKKEKDSKIKVVSKKRSDLKIKKAEDEGYELTQEDRKPKFVNFLNINPTDHEYAEFKLIEDLKKTARQINEEANEKEVSSVRRNLDPKTATLLVKEFVRLCGLEEVGIVKLTEDDFYSHRGFNKENSKYGDKVDIGYKYAIVFSAPMSREYVNRAPAKEIVMTSMYSYTKSAEVSARLSSYIKDLGFNTMTDNYHGYHTPISFLGERAGLGQMGRCNAVVSPKYGNKTKFAAVFTDLPLITDEPVDFGLKEFCELCSSCANNCPKKAIAQEAKYNDKGVKYWEHNTESCTQMWAATGHSCGICMSACPFTQGVDKELVSQMKDNQEVMNEILEKHVEKFGKRNYNKEPLEFMPKKR